MNQQPIVKNLLFSFCGSHSIVALGVDAQNDRVIVRGSNEELDPKTFYNINVKNFQPVTNQLYYGKSWTKDLQETYNAFYNSDANKPDE